MRIVVCDDEGAEVDKLCSLVQELLRTRELVAEVRGITDYKRFLEDMSKVRADIVLLDVCMGEHNGIEAARVLRRFNEDCMIIFVTSSREYAVEAFEVTAAHYLVKPVTHEKLEAALARTRFFSSKRKHLHVTVDYADLRVPLDDILYIETVGRKTRLYLKNGSSIDAGMTLVRISEQLLEEPQFFSCYRGIIVNADYVQSLAEEGLSLKGTVQLLPVSRKRFGEIRRYYHEYLILKVRSLN